MYTFILNTLLWFLFKFSHFRYILLLFATVGLSQRWVHFFWVALPFLALHVIHFCKIHRSKVYNYLGMQWNIFTCWNYEYRYSSKPAIFFLWHFERHCLLNGEWWLERSEELRSICSPVVLEVFTELAQYFFSEILHDITGLHLDVCWRARFFFTF